MRTFFKRREFLKISGSFSAATALAAKTSQFTEADTLQSEEIAGDSFIDLLDNFAELNPPVMIYREGQDFQEWQKAFRNKVEALRGPLPRRVPAEYQIIKKEELPDHSRLLIRFPVSEISDAVAYVLIPQNISPGEKRPGLVALHGHTEYGIDHICGVRPGYTAYALSAVQSGFVVIAPAWWGWIGRNGHLPRVGKNRDRCNTIQMAAGMYGLNVLDLHIQDGQAAVDVVSKFPQVDPARIGCMGNSYGGRTTMWLTLFEKRIKACVPSGCMNNFRERSLKLSSCAIQYLPGILHYGDVPELFSLIAPRPMQLQAGKGDNLITPADRDAMRDVVRNGYKKMGKPENFEYVLHQRGHSLQWKFAETFFRKHL